MRKFQKYLFISAIILASGFAVISASQSAKEPEKAAVTYEIVGDKMSTSTTSSASTDYEMVDTITAYGTEGGLQSSSSYSVEVSNTLTAEGPATSVSDWKTLD